ncbi:MAG: hypothetical protein C4310_09480, partial [Chloroflexota bacterium]
MRIYERNRYAGGHATSFTLTSTGRGNESLAFTFDEGPHVSFTKDAFVREFLAESVGGELDEHVARISNYYR